MQVREWTKYWGFVCVLLTASAFTLGDVNGVPDSGKLAACPISPVEARFSLFNAASHRPSKSRVPPPMYCRPFVDQFTLAICAN